jgi:hypothetical protein
VDSFQSHAESTFAFPSREKAAQRRFMVDMSRRQRFPVVSILGAGRSTVKSFLAIS